VRCVDEFFQLFAQLMLLLNGCMIFVALLILLLMEYLLFLDCFCSLLCVCKCKLLMRASCIHWTKYSWRKRPTAVVWHFCRASPFCCCKMLNMLS